MSVVVLLAQLVVDDDELRLPLRVVLLPGPGWLARQARIVSEPCVTRPIPVCGELACKAIKTCIGESDALESPVYSGTTW